MWSGIYSEKYELEFILGILRPGMTFIDVGANVGLFSIAVSKKIEPDRVFAFEPSGWTCQRLIQNARLNNLENLHVTRAALGDYKGEALLQVNASGKDGLNTIGRPSHSDSEINSTESVPITTLDLFLRENGRAHVDVMKVDVEGAELLVFRGAEELLAKSDAPLILYESSMLTEGFGYHPVETMWLLERHGYSFFTIDSRDGRIKALTGVQVGYTMVIAVKPSHPSYPVLRERAR
jgi:FkbM family methyltransferase